MLNNTRLNNKASIERIFQHVVRIERFKKHFFLKNLECEFN